MVAVVVCRANETQSQVRQYPFRCFLLVLMLGAGRTNVESSGAAPRASYDTESDIHAKVELTYAMPDGTTFCKTVTAGDTVAQVKKHLADARGIPYSAITLKLSGKAMMDPLSLNDLPAAKGKTQLTLDVELKG